MLSPARAYPVAALLIIFILFVIPAATQAGPAPQVTGEADPAPLAEAGPDTDNAPTAVGLNIEPLIPGCLGSDGHPQVEARITPDYLLAEARLYFRAYGSTRDYYVLFEAEEDRLTATLPRPLESTRRVAYWLRAFDRSGVDFRTSEFMLELGTLSPCSEDVSFFDDGEDELVRPTRALVIGLTADDQSLVPPGFSADGVRHYRTAAGVRKEVPPEWIEGREAPSGWSRLHTGTKIAIIAGSAAVVMGAAMLAGEDNTEDRDDDGDGYSENGGDCNDNDPDIYPGASEICDDGLDNDCDDRTDLEDSPDCDEWMDRDGDGYRVVDGDCNDFDPTINPDAQEDCDDNVDNDCDGLIDGEDYEDCQGSEDFDGDGFPADHDCDDTNPFVNPGAREDCLNRIDDDCDGLIDQDDPDCEPVLVFLVLFPDMNTGRNEVMALWINGEFMGQTAQGGDLTVARQLGRGKKTARVELISDPDQDGTDFRLQISSWDPSVESITPSELTGRVVPGQPWVGEFIIN